MRKLLILVLWVALMASATLSFAQESILMVTYGPDAMTKEGDNDFKQIIFLLVPQTVTDTLYLRIFDADCGDELDSPFGAFDSQTQFQLFGGEGAYSAATVKTPFPDEGDIVSGTSIASEIFGVNRFRDKKWYNLAEFSPTAGEKVGGNYIFKLVVSGVSGNDGNVYDIAVSSSDSRNRPPEGLKIFSYALTIRLPGVGVFAEMPFFVPTSMDEISVHNFDLAGASVGIETAYRSNLQVASSGQGEWSESKVIFEKNERNRLCAVTFEGGGEIPNDATFYLTDSKDETVPIQMPVYIRKSNNRPVPQVDIKTLSDGRTVVFDGARSTDEDGEALEFFWNFDDAQTADGAKVSHTYDTPGRYEVTLTVDDGSSALNGKNTLTKVLMVNHPPAVNAGHDQIVGPGETVAFDASRSSDSDGKIVKYSWNFGDGTQGEGQQVSHVYEKFGSYEVRLTISDNSATDSGTVVDAMTVVVNAPPVVEAGPDQKAFSGGAHDAVFFDGTKSQDPDGGPLTFLWDFGDGTNETGAKVSHTYTKPGKYIVRLRVRDSSGVPSGEVWDELNVNVTKR